MFAYTPKPDDKMQNYINDFCYRGDASSGNL